VSEPLPPGSGPSERILQWLTARGLILEMEVARELAASGWHVTQSEPYEDAQTRKARETDINAKLQEQVGDRLLCLELVVECKTSASRPWILLASPSPFNGTSWAFHSAVSQLGQEFLSAYTMREEDKLRNSPNTVFADIPMFAWPARTAFRFVEGYYQAPQGGGDTRDGGFVGVMQLAAALEQFNKQCESRPPWVVDTICEILIPVVVVNDNLFECWMEPDGNIKVESTHRGVLVTSRDLDSPLSNYVVITDRVGFREFMNDARISFRRLVELAPEVMPKALENLKEDLEAHAAESERMVTFLQDLALACRRTEE
jgi:hypothetical protein